MRPLFFLSPIFSQRPSQHRGDVENFAKQQRFRCCQGGPSSADDESPPLISPNWREFRASLIAGSSEQHEKAKETAYRTGHWAHALSLPETGCFLASHPAYYRRKFPYLTQSVVFLTHYEPGIGATGLVLNRPLKGMAKELEMSGLFGRSLKISETGFANEPVYTGGPDTLEKGILSVLHSDRKAGGVQPLDGVFICDIKQYISLSSSTDYTGARLFLGCLRWPAGELESEVSDGSWYCISASELFAIKHCIQLPKPLWVEIMQCQGGLFEHIANRVYNKSEEDIEEG